MSKKIFFSIATSENPIHIEYEARLTELFDNNGFELVKLKNWNDKNPLHPIHELLKECVGCLVLLLERYYVNSGISKRGSPDEKALKQIAITTPWCHIEAGMAYTLGLPLLILREKSVFQDGLFDDYIETFPQFEIDIANFKSLESGNERTYMLTFFNTLNNHLKLKMNDIHSKNNYTKEKEVIVIKPIKKLKLFLSYAHEDEIFKTNLDRHLIGLKQSDKIEVWHDRKIDAGSEYNPAISNELNDSDIIILMISVDFLNSEYIYQKELKTALVRHEKKNAIVIPIIARPVDWNDTTFRKIQSLPRDGSTIAECKNKDRIYTEISKEIKNVVNKRLSELNKKISEIN